MKVLSLHHVSLPVSDLARSIAFYRDVLGLETIERPPFSFAGAWFRLADRELHLVDGVDPTFRAGKPAQGRDLHFAVRVDSFSAALNHLRSQGFSEDAPPGDLRRFVVSRAPATGYPQIFLLDPDRHLIEINAASVNS